MKTITALLTSIVAIVIFIVLLIYSSSTLLLSNHFYQNLTTKEVHSFEITFVFNSIILLILSFVSLSIGFKSFMIFIANLTNDLEKKEDNNIKKKLKYIKLSKLYNDLNNTNEVDKKEELVKDYFEDKIVNEASTSLKELFNQINKKKLNNLIPKPFND